MTIWSQTPFKVSGTSRRKLWKEIQMWSFKSDQREQIMLWAPQSKYCVDETSVIINGTPMCWLYLWTLMDLYHPNALFKSAHTAVCPPPASCVSSSRLWILLSHFLILDLPKIALTGDINGLLLASSWLLQIFWKREIEGKSRRESKKERKRETERENMEVLRPPLLTGDRLSLW